MFIIFIRININDLIPYTLQISSLKNCELSCLWWELFVFICESSMFVVRFNPFVITDLLMASCEWWEIFFSLSTCLEKICSYWQWSLKESMPEMWRSSKMQESLPATAWWCIQRRCLKFQWSAKLWILCFNMLIMLFGFMQHLTGIKGLSEAKVDKICEAAEKLVVRAHVIPCKMLLY